MQSMSSKKGAALAGESGEMYRIAELDLQIKKMEEPILQQRSDMGINEHLHA